MTYPLRKHLLNAAKWIFSIGLLAYALHEIDYATMRDMVTKQSPIAAMGVVMLLTLQLGISTFRWQRVVVLLSKKTFRPAYVRLFNLNFVSVFFNSCLPGTIGGDVVRAMLLKNSQLPMHLCFHSVIIDRLFALAGVFVMVIISLPLMQQWITTLPTGALLVGAATAAGLGLLLLDKAPALLAPFAGNRMVTHAARLLENMRHVVFSPVESLVMLAQAVIAHACYCISIYWLAQNLGADLTLLESLVLTPPVMLLMMLPISVGGWGIREVSMVGFFSLVGIPNELALAVSVQMGVLTIIASLPGALCYFKQPKS